MKKYVLLLLLLSFSVTGLAGGVYQEPDAFVTEAFAGHPPKAAVIWPSSELKAQMKQILGHDYKGLRIRYWKERNRTAWILDEIGKDKPITTGFITNQGKIETVRVLIFRESRGWEVRHAFFTDQFDNVALTNMNRLDRNIDNITGATLSVRAVTKLARVALLLDEAVGEKNNT